MKFAREKQREKSALHDPPALRRAGPTCKSQTQTDFAGEYSIRILKAVLKIIIHNF